MGIALPIDPRTGQPPRPQFAPYGTESEVPRMRAATPWEQAGDLAEDFMQTPAGKGLRWAAELAFPTDPESAAMSLVNPLQGPAMPAVALVKRAAPEALKSRLAIEGAEYATSGLTERIKWLQDALYRYAESHPRLMSHIKSVKLQPKIPDNFPGSPGALASMSSNRMGAKVRQRGINEVRDWGAPFFDMELGANVLRLVRSPEDAYGIIGHELTHGSQFLMDPSRADLAYGLGKQAGRGGSRAYQTHPAERLARMTQAAREFEEPITYAARRETTAPELLTGADPLKAAREAWLALRNQFTRHPKGR